MATDAPKIPTTITRTLPPGASITLDATISRAHKRAVAITDFPVEEGINISDHMRPKPAVFNFDGLVSDLAPTDLTGSSVAEAHAFFKDLHENPGLVSITSQLNKYTDMGMESLDMPETVELGASALKLTAQFKYVRIVSIKKSTKDAAQGRRVQKGPQQKVPAEPIAKPSFGLRATANGLNPLATEGERAQAKKVIDDYNAQTKAIAAQKPK